MIQRSTDFLLNARATGSVKEKTDKFKEKDNLKTVASGARQNTTHVNCLA
jgi:hypothetical protein